MKKSLITLIIAVVVIGAGSFYGGMQYSKKKSGSSSVGNLRGGSNLTADQRAKFGQRQSGATMGVGGGFRQNSSSTNFINGEILKKEANSLTVKLSDGGSALVYISTSTTSITKQSTTTLSDLSIGSTVMINGDKNDDGSYSAKIIRL